jgi:O-methyltransferase involved in polyketide biosynthesis
MAVDFEREPFSVALRRGGFRTEAAAVFAWLGVVPYLTRTAAMQTLRSIAQTHGNEVVFDYADMASPIDARSRAALEELSRRVANAGEPFRSSFEPQELAGELRTMGFTAREDWDAARLNARYFERRTDGLRLGARGHIMHARV